MKEQAKKYIVRAFFAPDGDKGGKLAEGQEVAESFISELITRGAYLSKDLILNDINGFNYSYYRLYLQNGAFALLQDLNYSKQEKEY